MKYEILNEKIKTTIFNQEKVMVFILSMDKSKTKEEKMQMNIFMKYGTISSRVMFQITK